MKKTANLFHCKLFFYSRLTPCIPFTKITILNGFVRENLLRTFLSTYVILSNFTGGRTFSPTFVSISDDKRRQVVFKVNSFVLFLY